MTETITLAPVGSSEREAVKLDGTNDMTVFAGLAKKAGIDLTILDGVVNLNRGSSGDPSGGGYVRPGKGAVIEGSKKTIMAAPSSIVRMTLDQPDVTLTNLDFRGRGHVQVFGTSGHVLLDHVRVSQADEAGNHIDLHGNCTAGFLFYAKSGQTLRDVELRSCSAEKTYHHGMSMHVYGADEGGTFRDFLFEDCLAFMCGMAKRAPRKGENTPYDYRVWTTGINTADTGDVIECELVRCKAEDAVQSGFHCDGSWTGHLQRIVNLIYQECVSVRNGWRCLPQTYEKFRAGFYGQSAEYINCTAEENAGPGFATKNQKPGELKMKGCRDIGSLYGAIVEYESPGARIELISERARERAFLGQVTAGGTLDLTVIDGPKKAIMFGKTIRSDYIDCPNHAAEVNGKYAAYKYTLDGSKITIRYQGERPAYEVYERSKLIGSPTFVLLEDDQEVPVVILPNPVPVGSLYAEDGAIWIQAPECRPMQLAWIPEDLQRAGGVSLRTQDGAVWVAANGLPARFVTFIPGDYQQFYPNGTMGYQTGYQTGA
jgi:hypothetical protein